MRNINSTLLDKTRTSVFIAHRLRTVVEAGQYLYPFTSVNANSSPDLIIVLRDGQVVEQGTHEELLRRGGLYASMWQQQVSAELFDNEVLQ